jgi:hypothetical protein
VVDRRVEQEKIRTELRDWEREAVDQQLHPDVSGVSAMTCF